LILVNSGLDADERVLEVFTIPKRNSVECSCALVPLHVLNLLERALTKVPVIGLFPGKAAIGPVKPTFSAGAGTTGFNATAEPSSDYKLVVSDIIFRNN